MQLWKLTEASRSSKAIVSGDWNDCHIEVTSNWMKNMAKEINLLNSALSGRILIRWRRNCSSNHVGSLHHYTAQHRKIRTPLYAVQCLIQNCQILALADLSEIHVHVLLFCKKKETDHTAYTGNLPISISNLCRCPNIPLPSITMSDHCQDNEPRKVPHSWGGRKGLVGQIQGISGSQDMTLETVTNM